ncbi:FHA domain-containing protein, partial [Mycobacterium sp.]|uniref:FHA domain-containing protein n=1 Tax=Mycobacterium sp. TaxID=1785 RepID=UPI003C76C36F
PDQGGYPDQRGGYPDQGGYPQHQQQPAPGYGGGQGYDQGYQQGGYGQPGGQGYGEYADYGRGPARQDEGGYAAPDQRAAYPEQGGGGYDQGYAGGPEYGRQDYAQQPDYGSYGEAPAPQYGSGYAEPAGGDYDYGQPQEAGGYGGYSQGGYPSSGTAVTLQLDDGSGRTYQLRDGANIIGRGQDAQFRLPDTGVSRRHLEIRWDGHVALLSDLNSTNGTTVNNAPVQEWQLADGDVIRLGHSEIVVHIH